MNDFCLGESKAFLATVAQPADGPLNLYISVYLASPKIRIFPRAFVPSETIRIGEFFTHRDVLSKLPLLPCKPEVIGVEGFFLSFRSDDLSNFFRIFLRAFFRFF